MLFKDMKPGYPVYLLDKGTVKATTGKIINVSQPHFSTPQTGANFTPSTQMYVDVTVEIDGRTQTYSIPETLTITYTGNSVLSTDKDGILREAEALKSRSETALKEVDKHKETITLCDTLLSEWNPVFADKKKQEERINGLEEEVRGLGAMLKDFINDFKK